MHTQQTKQLNPNAKLSMVERIAYGLGDYSANLVYSAISAFLLVYYTNVLGVPALVGSTVMAISKIFDGISDLIMGRIVDRTKSRFGKARPWILRMCIPLAVCNVLLYSVPAGLAEGCGVQVDQHPQAVLFCPGKGLVQLLNAAQKWRPVAENEVGHRNPNRVHPDPPDGGEIPLGDIFAAVDPDPRLVYLRRELQRQMVFVLRRRTLEQGGTHPLFQHQPVSQIDAFHIHSVSSLP